VRLLGMKSKNLMCKSASHIFVPVVSNKILVTVVGQKINERAKALAANQKKGTAIYSPISQPPRDELHLNDRLLIIVRALNHVVNFCPGNYP
jgi:hypothetical protein